MTKRGTDNSNEEHESFKHVLKSQIKCLQNINLIKYRPNLLKNKNARLSYFAMLGNHLKAAEESEEEAD